MPPPRVVDPLVPVPLRLPSSLVEQLRSRATAADCSVSDVLRSHLTLEPAKPLAKRRPTKREPKRLGSVSGADPALLRQLSGLGNSMNQVARAVNSGAVVGTPTECVQVLATLRSIDLKLASIEERHAH